MSNNDQTIVETEIYEIPLEDYLIYEWYAAQMEVTVDYLLEEFYIGNELIVPDNLVDYDYECDS
jgi:hypothetical protein